MSGSRTTMEARVELRERKYMLDNSWILAIVLSGSSIVIFWYLGLGQVDIAPIFWTLALLALAQFGLSWRGQTCVSTRQVRWFAMASQSVGVVGMGVAWHLFGGVQQPMFPLFIMLPLFTGSVLLSFWQQQLALFLFLGLLLSGVLLSPDTNSFIEQRYGLSVVSADWLPGWIPKSRIAFADVSTSPAYNLMLTGSLAILSIALSGTARGMVALSSRLAEHARTLRAELKDAGDLSSQLVANSPSAEVLVARNTGRILQASDRFVKFLKHPSPLTGEFLLDTLAFSYPAAVKRLLAGGGDDIQEATVGGRDLVLRLHAGVIESRESDVVRLSIEGCDDLCWQSAVDALPDPVFAVNAKGNVLLLNRSAVALFGRPGDGVGIGAAVGVGAAVGALFDDPAAMGRWWDLGPLESACRVLHRDGRHYVASIYRERIANSVADLSFVHLQVQERAHAVTVA